MATKNQFASVNNGVVSFDSEVVETRLGFKPDETKYGGLCIGYISDVELTETEVAKTNEDGSENPYEYAGLKVPSLVIHFKQAKDKDNNKDRYYDYRVTPIVTRNNKGEKLDVNIVVNLLQAQYASLRHICNAFKGMENYDDKLSPKTPSIDINAAAAERIKQFKKFYTFFADLLKGKGETPLYEKVMLWMKIVADYNTGTRYGFPQFVGRGFIERYFNGTAPSIEIGPNDSIKLVAKKKGKTEESAESASGLGDFPIGETSEGVQSILDKYNK